MGLTDLIRSADARLQYGAEAVSSKANEVIGVGNYHLSSLFFGASGFVYGLPGLVNLVNDERSISRVALQLALGIGWAGYQIRRNMLLEHMEMNSEEQRQESDAISLDFNLTVEKRALWAYPIVGPIGDGKLGYTLMTVGLLFFEPVFAVPASGFLMAQYFREVDLIKPTKKNRVFDFVGNLMNLGKRSQQQT